jgi:hypothetical protein
VSSNVSIKVVGERVVNSMVALARPGDSVVIVDRFGKEHRDRVVMKFSSHLVLNMGGAHGRPGIADDSNIVRVIAKKAKAVSMPGSGLIAAMG